ncbi:MAG TPA: RsmE family RNA methyltransferase [Acidimicrobiia bacterium]
MTPGDGVSPTTPGDGVSPTTPGWAAAIAASAHVFVAELPDTLELDGDDAHHLNRVLRLRGGEVVTAADGAGRWRPYVVTAGAQLEATGPEQREPDLQPRLAIAFALTKGDKPELAVQKLTELGADRILPVLAERSIARPEPARAAAQGQRWRRVAREAGRQCRRARLPEVADLAPLASLAGHPGLVVAERGGAPLAALPAGIGDEMLIVTGPEGGLTDAEVELLGPVFRFGLGPHILRAETAAMAAAAVVAGLRDSRPRAAGADAGQPG